jgi:hypothetical protein
MRNLKKLLAAIVTVCMLATFAVPAFAEKSDADICTDLGMILGEGSGVTAEYLASQPYRLQGAIMFLRLKGLEDEAKAFVVTEENFSDVDGLNETNKAILGYLKAHPELGFVGVGNNMFAPFKEMTAKEYYKVLLVALGYEEGVDFTWANLLQFAATKGLVKLLDNTAFTVNDLCVATVEALKATVKGGDDNLITMLVEAGVIAADKAVATGLYSGVPRALQVVSASADNLKTAKLVFSKELDKNTVNKDNISNDDIEEVKLLDDKKTVLLIFKDGLKQGNEKKVTIKNVKSTDGAKIAEVDKTITFYDTAFPTITGAVAEDAKSIVVSVSEPIDLEYGDVFETYEDIEIDDQNMIAQASFDFVKNTITFTLNDVLDAGSHKISIKGLKDYAGYIAMTASFNIAVAEDKTAPEIVKGEVVSVTKIKATFSENLEEIGDYEVDDKDVDATFDKNSKKVVVLEFEDADDKLSIGAIVEIKVKYKGQRDVAGNEVSDWKTFKFKVEDDTTLPTATASLDSENNLTITFSKAMLKEGTLKVYDKDEKLKEEITIADNANWDSDTVLKYDADEIGLDEVDAADYYIVLEDMYDGTIRKNPLSKEKMKVTAQDTKDPKAEEFYTVDDDKITFYYSEAMDADSIKTLSNYRLAADVDNPGDDHDFAAGTSLALKALGAKVKSVASDGKSITITVEKIDLLPGATFNIWAVKDKAGNYLDKSGTISKYAGSFELATDDTVDTVVAKSDKELEVTFNSAVKTFSTSVFSGVYNDADERIAYIKNYKIDGVKVKLTLSKAIPTDPSGLYLMPKAVGEDITAAKNIYGDALVIADAEVGNFVDKIAPTAKVETGEDDGEIKITFSETVDLGTDDNVNSNLVIRKTDGTLLRMGATEGYTLNVDDTNDVVIVTILDKDGNKVINTEYKVSIVTKGNIVDVKGNVLAEMAEKKVKTGKTD